VRLGPSAAGLIYEIVWSRYLTLYVGNSVQAQVLVLVVFLGGMALGSLTIAERSERLHRPLVWYALAEGVLAVAALGFHLAFTTVTDFSYDVLFPALGSASVVGAARWGVAAFLILGQAMVLGATFPLMVSGLVRRDPSRPGRATADAYLVNTLGAAAGVLIAGFWLVGAVGLPGAMAGGAILNVLAAALILVVVEHGTRPACPAEYGGPTRRIALGPPNHDPGVGHALGQLPHRDGVVCVRNRLDPNARGWSGASSTECLIRSARSASSSCSWDWRRSRRSRSTC